MFLGLVEVLLVHAFFISFLYMFTLFQFSLFQVLKNRVNQISSFVFNVQIGKNRALSATGLATIF